MARAWIGYGTRNLALLGVRAVGIIVEFAHAQMTMYGVGDRAWNVEFLDECVTLYDVVKHGMDFFLRWHLIDIDSDAAALILVHGPTVYLGFKTNPLSCIYFDPGFLLSLM